MHIPFKQVDVFTSVPYAGNPVAVILDAKSLSDAQMQSIANWTNLSETTFVLPPTQAGADYRVRIFAPRSEIPFGGHPTIGTAHALIEAGLVVPKTGKLVQECMVGLVPLTVTGDGSDRQIAFELPTPSFIPLAPDQIDEMTRILGVSEIASSAPKFVNVGPIWTVVQLPDAKAVLALTPDMIRLAEFDQRAQSVGVIVFGEYGPGADGAIELRAFAPTLGCNEDPVCGSGNGAAAAFIFESGQLKKFGPSYMSSQGAMVGRAGKIAIAIDAAGGVRVGGQSVTCIDGTIDA